jgi:hypothetical protein
MAINEWWEGDPRERYWLEITDRENLGLDLHAPQFDGSGKSYWSYELVTAVRPGDVVLHWWKQAGAPEAIVGHSTAVGNAVEAEIVWQAHGTVGRAAGRATRRPGWLHPLVDFTDLEAPVTLERLREIEPSIRLIRDRLATEIAGPLYYPYALSDKRPLRTTQGYLVKFPADLVDAIPELRAVLDPENGRSAPRSRSGVTRAGTGYQSDLEVRRALERHAVDWTMAHYKELGYSVEDVGAVRSYDVEARNGDELFQLEVKGSSGTATTVELTRGEVEEAWTSGCSVLVVVDEISWARTHDGAVKTSGGRPRIWAEWAPEEDRLVPVSYRYLLPPEAAGSASLALAGRGFVDAGG